MFISPEATVVAVKTAQAFVSRVINEFIYGNLISFLVSKVAQFKSRMLNSLLSSIANYRGSWVEVVGHGCG